jgi:HSP20 family molecular chaperone IbpA
LPDNTIREDIKAKYEDDILLIHLKKNSQKKQAKKEIQIS